MGITIDVANIYHDTLTWRYKLGDKPLKQYIRLICDALNLETISWDETIEKLGTIHTSANYSRYALAMDVAKGILPEIQPYIHKAPFGLLNVEKRFEHFRHFLDIDEYTNFYLPIDFHPPQHLANKHASADGFMIGSVTRLASEMEDLLEEIAYYIEILGYDNVVKEDGSLSHTWSGLHDFCTILHSACVESINLQIPVLLKW